MMLKNIRALACAAVLIASGIGCGPVLAGPIDNANQFVDQAVENAETNNNAPAGQSGDDALISWEGQSSGPGTAVNVNTDNSADAQQ